MARGPSGASRASRILADLKGHVLFCRRVEVREKNKYKATSSMVLQYKTVTGGLEG